MKERMEIKNLDELYEAILHLETVEECRSFFKDLCTIPDEELKKYILAHA